MSCKPVLFDTGFVMRTPAVLIALLEAQVSETSLIERHQRGDFGDVSEVERRSNGMAIGQHGSVLSTYRLNTGAEVIVFTDAERQETTLLLARRERREFVAERDGIGEPRRDTATARRNTASTRS